MLINPTADDVDNLVNIFCRLTKLKAWAAKEYVLLTVVSFLNLNN